MIAASSYPAVAARLKEIFAADLGDNIVWRGAPINRAGREAIFIGGVETGTQTIPVARAGRKHRDEEYFLIVNINVSKDGVEPTSAEQRAFELFSRLEDLVYEDVTLGLNEPTLRAEWSEYECDSYQDDPGWRCIIVAKLRVRVRLT